jgi:hypothetical protein
MNTAQHGFIKSRSTTTALVDFVEKVMNSNDNREAVLGVFYDYSKAFDTVNHDLLLHKLHNIGISGVANNWVRSFLKNRIQVVRTHDKESTYLSGELVINVGVPQGAIISPLMFVLFTNDLPDNVSVGSVTLYADDTTHHISTKNSDLVKAAREAVRDIQTYSERNDLFLNKNKVVLINFTKPTSNKRDKSSPLLYLEGQSIHEKSHVKFLGVEIDKNLDWIEHCNKLCVQLSTGCYLLRKIRDISDEHTAKLVYYAHIHSRLQYGVALWGHTQAAKRVFRIQKKALRILAKASHDPCCPGVFYKDSCVELFLRFKIMTLPAIYIYQTILVYLANTVPDEYQSAKEPYTLRNERREDKYSTNFKLTTKSPIRAGYKLWSALPNDLKNKSSHPDPSVFKSILKNWLVGKCFYSIDDYLAKDGWI